MSTTSKLQAAINRSSTYNEIVNVNLSDLDDTSDAVLCILADLTGDLESDSVRNGDVIECWAWDREDTNTENMEWRIHIHTDA